MLLQEFIAKETTSFPATAYGRDKAKRWRQCGGQLAGYEAGHGKCDLLAAIDPEFSKAYFRHLYEEAGAGKSYATVDEWIAKYVMIVRRAIENGCLPNINTAADVKRSLAKVKGLEESHSRTSRKPYAASHIDFDNEVNKLIRILAKAVAPYSADVRALAAYAFCLACNGLEPEELKELRPADSNSGSGSMVATASGGRLIKLSDTAFSLLHYLGDINLNDPASPLLPGTTKPDFVEQLRNSLTRALSHNAIALFRAGNIITDRLGLAICQGRNEADVIAVARAHLSGDMPTKQDTLLRIGAPAIDRKMLLTPKWRILRIFAAKAEREAISRRVEQAISKQNNAASCHLIEKYIPHESGRNRGKKATTPVLSNYIFIRSTSDDAAAIEKEIANIGFVRSTDDNRTPATVRDEEIHRLQAFLHDYGEGVSLVDLAQWRRENASRLDPGQRVRITQGPFSGREGIVHKVKSLTDPCGTYSVFVVRIDAPSPLSLTITAELDGLRLVPVD